MPLTFERIGSFLVTGKDVNRITFNNIPQNYTDLKILLSVRSNVPFGQAGTSQYDAFECIINNNLTASQYAGRNFYMFNNLNGVGTVGGETQDNSRQVGFIQGNMATPGAYSNSEIYIPNYAATNIEKNLCVTTSNASNIYGSIMCYAVDRYTPSTAPITSLAFRVSWGTGFIDGSYATMYGIRRA